MRNIKRPSKLENLMKMLTERTQQFSKKTLFGTQREFLAFAAVLGFNEGRRTPLDSDTIELDSRVFIAHEQSLDLIYLIGVAEKKDVSIFLESNEDELITIFEEYCHTGLLVIDGWLKDLAADIYASDTFQQQYKKMGFLPNDDSTSSKPSPEGVTF